jgi:DNA-directed RNA polymerase specialized sigma24 family protein
MGAGAAGAAGSAVPVGAGCFEREPWWRRVVHAAGRRGDRILLTVVGLLVVIGPSLIPWLATVRTEVLVLGVGIVVLGVVMPSVAEAEIGLQGLRFRRLVEARDREFDHELPDAEIAELTRFARHLGVGPEPANDLVADACVRAYRDWHLVRHQPPRSVVLCHLVRQALRADALGLLAPAATAVEDAVLGQLSMRDRALLLLHVYEGYDEGEIARIMAEPIERIHEDLGNALAVLTAEPDVPTVGPS